MSDAKLDDAMASERALGDRATCLRGETHELTPDLFLKLWPLLREKIPDGFIRSLGKMEGKPYASIGVSAVQVQVTRMDNVLTPLWWWDEVEYHKDGKLAHVRVHVGDAASRTPLYSREAWGGVNRGSTEGNLYKGSYTNAAKVAFARVGPGHEVYMGATDFDPDTDEEAAKEQGKSQRASSASAGPRLLTDDERERVGKAIEDLGLGEKSVGLLLGSIGVEDVASMTTADAFELHRLIAEKGSES